MLRFRESYAAGEKEKAWQKLRDMKADILHGAKKHGIYPFVRRYLSLKALYY